MPKQLTAPSHAEVLHAIAGLFKDQPSSAALAHYPTLRIQTNNLHDALFAAIRSSDLVIEGWASELTIDERVEADFRLAGTVLFPYRTIAPMLARNVHRVAGFLMEEARALPAVDVDRVSETTPDFSDFVKLCAAVRGFLDALVQASYQLTTFNGLQFNYKFLQSLLSFATVAPESLHANIVSPQIQYALDSYVALSKQGKKNEASRKNSSFTQAAHEQFPQRLGVSAKIVDLPEWRQRNLGLVFGFCSDFVHSGYVSIVSIGGLSSGLVLGGPGDAFDSGAENFAEVKLRLLSECAGAYADLFLPALRRAMGCTMATGAASAWAGELEMSTRKIGDLRAILNRELVEPVRRGALGSDAVMRIECMCGAKVELRPPHNAWDCYCGACGSRFRMHEVGDEVDYVVSAAGVGDVLGGDAPKISSLAPSVREKLARIAGRHAPSDEGGVRLLLIADLERCDEDTLDVPFIISSEPTPADRGRCSLIAFVAAKSMSRCPVVRVRCNCGGDADYKTSDGTNVVQCQRCQAQIGLVGVSGDGVAVFTRNPDGSRGTAPIQGRDRFSVSGLAVGEVM